MTEPYPCSKCGEFLIKLETRLSKYGYMIPTNFFDGVLSKRGENHICSKDTKQQKPKPEYVSEKMHELHEYMKNMLRLGNDNWWHGWRDDKYVGRVERAKPEDYQSWSP